MSRYTTDYDINKSLTYINFKNYTRVHIVIINYYTFDLRNERNTSKSFFKVYSKYSWPLEQFEEVGKL